MLDTKSKVKVFTVYERKHKFSIFELSYFYCDENQNYVKFTISIVNAKKGSLL